MSAFQDIREAIQKQKIIDTHEHLPIAAEKRGEHRDVLAAYLEHYLSSDLRSAGLSEMELAQARDANLDIKHRWEIIAPYYEACQDTGYARAIQIAMRDLHGVEKLNGDTIEALQASYEKTYSRDYFYEVLHDRCHIEGALLDSFDEDRFGGDARLFRRVWRPEKYINPQPVAGQVFRWIEGHYGSIESLDDWMSAFEEELCEYCSRGINTLKIGLAYDRDLTFKEVSYRKAKEAFDKVLENWELDGRGTRDDFQFPMVVQDFMMRHILSSLRGRDAVIQIHTGLQEGNSNILQHSHPMKLNNLFKEYDDVHFDLFHIGWPWWRQSLALVKMFPNVTLDMCWAHIISPPSAMACLVEAVQTVPANKILGFGGDYMFVDGVYGHLEMAKDNIARALALLVDEKKISSDRAIRIAQMILYDNPKRVFNL